KAVAVLLGLFFYVCVFVIAVLFSNRLAGALFRLRKHMRSTAKGEPASPIRFRSDDYFIELNSAYNELIESLPPGRKKSGNKGFSMMELMITVAIIGIMTTMAAAFYANNGVASLQFSQDVANLQGILMAGRSAAINMNECTQVTV